MNRSNPLNKYHTFSKWTPNDVTLKRKTADEIHRFISFQVPDRKVHRRSLPGVVNRQKSVPVKIDKNQVIFIDQ